MLEELVVYKVDEPFLYRINVAVHKRPNFKTPSCQRAKNEETGQRTARVIVAANEKKKHAKLQWSLPHSIA